MTTAVLMDMTAACLSFPELPEMEITRETFLDAVDVTFTAKVPVVVLEGTDGVGKTTFLAQYARKHRDNALCLFLRPTNKGAYDPDRLRWDLCNQLEWTLHNQEIKNWDVATDSFFRQQKASLARKIRRMGAHYYVIVDGLDQVPDESGDLRQIIMDMLPFEIPGCRFLFSSSPDKVRQWIPRGILAKTVSLPGFSLDETLKFFSDLNLDSDFVTEIHHACRKIPDNLASVRRLIRSGYELSRNDLHNQLRDLHEIEWNRVGVDRDTQLLLAVLAHDRNEHSVVTLSKLLGMTEDAVSERIARIPFLREDGHRSSHVQFVTDSFRKFCAEKLKVLRGTVNDVVIEYLMRDPSSDAALTNLPAYLDQASRHVELLQYLSPEHFAEMLGKSQSLSLVGQKMDLGLSAARKTGKDSDLMRFAIKRSSMSEMASMPIYESEIEARVALGEYDAAIALAESAMLKENRLRLLAMISRKLMSKGLHPRAELYDQIKHVYAQVDPTALGPLGPKIAADLVHSHPDLALELIEKCAHVEGEDNQALEWALARVSIAASAKEQDSMDHGRVAEQARNRIKSPEVLRAFNERSLLLGDVDPSAVIERVSKLEKGTDQLHLIRKWIGQNLHVEGASEVVEHAMELIIKEVTYTPNATVFRELAMALPHVANESKAKSLIGIFSGQIAGVEKIGPTIDLVWLQTLLAESEWKYDTTAARNRLVDAYLLVSELTELDIRTACLAIITRCLKVIDNDGNLELSEGMHSLVRDDLRTSMSRLLEETAEHFDATKRTIRALASVEPLLALDIALSLNIEPRRDQAILELLDHVLEVPTDKLNLDVVQQLLDTISDPSVKDAGLLMTLVQVETIKELDPQHIRKVIPLVNRVQSIRDASDRCLACCVAISILNKDSTNYVGLIDHMLSTLRESWESIDVGWFQIDVGFKVAEALAPTNPGKAREYLKLAEAKRHDVLVDDETTANTCIATLQLAVRAFAGLLPKSLNTPDDLAQLSSLIDRIPSGGIRAQAWGELALRCFINERGGMCSDIVTQYVKPLVSNIPEGDLAYRADVVVLLAPAFFCAHRPTALELISTLPSDKKDAALDEICMFILRKVPPYEPYDDAMPRGYDISYEDCIDLCELVGLMERDVIIYSICNKIADSLSRRRSDRFSQQQLSNIATKLESIIIGKLPNPKYIRHDGFKIVALAQVARLTNRRGPIWDELLNQARSIPNLSDRAYVLAILSTCVRDPQRQQLLDEAADLTESISSSQDKAERYQLLAELAVTERRKSQEFLRKAMQAAVSSNDPGMYPHQRKIVDYAYRIDPELASDLAALVDDDPARGAARTKLRRQIEILDLKQRMIDGDSSPGERVKDRSYYSHAAWRSLGALNANRAGHIHIEQTREYIEAAAKLSVLEAHPVFAWAIENAVKRHSRTEQARLILRPLFEATVMAAQLASRMAGRTFDQFERAKVHVARGAAISGGVLIRPGERDKAFQVIREWFETDVRGYLKICDPYFGPDELEVLQLLRSVVPDCRVMILTSRKHHQDQKITLPWSDAYQDHWRNFIADQEPPETEFVIVGTNSGGFPIHDRWWITNGSGLNIGTSLNSLGRTQESTISPLQRSEAAQLEAEVDRYLQRVPMEHNGERLRYELFSL